MKARYLLCFLIILLQLRGNAQCGFDDLYHQRMRTDTAFNSAITAMRQEYRAHREALKHTKQAISGTDTVIIIPLVIHIIHNGEPLGSELNPSDQQIKEWIRYTDSAFNGALPGSTGKPTGIRFVLAKTDPNCQPTTGIIRVNGSGVPNYLDYGIHYPGGIGGGADDPSIRNLSRWNWSEYFNVWVVSRIDDPNVGGYATMPLGYPEAGFGPVVMVRESRAGSHALAHELGHSFGLFHTFNGDNGGSSCPANTDCENYGDYICDTEPDLRWPSCNAAVNTCTWLPYGDIRVNIMNYTTCGPNQLTPGQAAAMHWYAGKYIPTFNSRAGDSLSGQARPGAACVNTRAASFDSVLAVCGPTFVNIGDITRISGVCREEAGAVYIDNTCLYHTDLDAGKAHALTITIRSQPQYVRVFLDYNNDGIFQVPAEQVVDTLFRALSVEESATFGILIPRSGVVMNKPLRLRIFADGKLHAGAGPCAAIVSGQAEDYAVTITPSLGIHPAGLRPDLSLAPNPAGTTTTLSYELTQPAAVRLLVVDATGRAVFSTQPASASAGKHTAEIQVSNLAPGIYAVMLSINGTVSATRLSVLR